MLSDQQLLDCQVLRGVAGVLELSAVATVTALTFLHRAHEQQQPHTGLGLSLNQQELVCACIYLAAKVEEVHVSTNQLINTARVLADPSQQHLLQALAPLPLALQQQQQHQPEHHGQHNAGVTPAGAPSPAAADTGPPSQQHPQQQQQEQQQPSAAIVVGDEYYAAKEQLFMAEQALLRTMRFELGVQQPHKHLLNYVALLDLGQHAAAAAVCVLNDAVAYTRLVCTHSAAVVAAAALQHVLATAAGAGEGANNSRGRGSRSSREQQQVVALGQWVSLVGLPDAEVDAAQQEIAGLYRRLG